MPDPWRYAVDKPGYKTLAVFLPKPRSIERPSEAFEHQHVQCTRLARNLHCLACQVTSRITQNSYAVARSSCSETFRGERDAWSNMYLVHLPCTAFTFGSVKLSSKTHLLSEISTRSQGCSTTTTKFILPRPTPWMIRATSLPSQVSRLTALLWDIFGYEDDDPVFHVANEQNGACFLFARIASVYTYFFRLTCWHRSSSHCIAFSEFDQ